MVKKWDPHKGRSTIRKLVKKKLVEAGPDGLPIGALAIALRKEGYLIPSIASLITMLSTLNLTLDPDGKTVHMK